MVNDKNKPEDDSDTHNQDLKGLGAAAASLDETKNHEIIKSKIVLLAGTPLYFWQEGEVPSFDLTTLNGLNEAKCATRKTILAPGLNYVASVGAAVGGIACAGSIWNLWGLLSIFKSEKPLTKEVSTKDASPSKTLESKKVAPDNQLKFAQAVIASGKKHGAKKVKITVDKDVGASLGASYVGASIKGQVDSGGKMHLEIEYK